MLRGVALLVAVWLVAVYNHFVGLRHHVKECWSEIDVEMRRRYELIPDLVGTDR